ncbi:hypothetical protein [Thermithiobacillus plumbiphilus]|uniref:Uncharacterized protein n=1 Tax=Thermithiobacillus plumbiphilus TaxID=1729899 RepID=A0ABU9D7J6_9PROT
MTEKKRILMIAAQKKVEALRMASGLTLLDDAVSIACMVRLPEGADAAEQLEALEFSEVPIDVVDLGEENGIQALALRIVDSDVVFCV